MIPKVTRLDFIYSVDHKVVRSYLYDSLYPPFPLRPIRENWDQDAHKWLLLWKENFQILKSRFSIICETFLCYALGSDSDINSGVPGQIHDSNCRGKKNDFLWCCQSTWPWAGPPSPPLSARAPQTCPIAPVKKSLISTTMFYFLWVNCNQPLSVHQREVLGVPANLSVHVFISNLSVRLENVIWNDFPPLIVPGMCPLM